MAKTKVAIIGLGGIAQLVHLPNLVKNGSATIAAVAEINKNRLNTIGNKFNIKEKFRDYKEMLAKCDIDAVIIATPTNTHKEIAIACLKAQKDILIEKPLALTYSETKQVMAAAKKYQKKVMVGMNLRFRPDAMLLRSLVKSGEIGEPYYIKCGWIRRQSSDEHWFTKKEEAGGGVTIDLGILMLDLALWLLDYPVVESVTTQNFYHYTKTVEDSSISFIRCKNSSLINIETSWSFPLVKDSFYLTVYGTKGSATINPFKVSKKIQDQYIELTPSRTATPMTAFKKSYTNELKSFLGGVQGLNPLFSPGHEALLRMKIIEAMYNSASQKSEIKI